MLGISNMLTDTVVTVTLTSLLRGTGTFTCATLTQEQQQSHLRVFVVQSDQVMSVHD